MVWIIKRQSFDWKFPGVRKPWLLPLDVDGLCIQHSLIKTKYTTSTGILKYAPWSLGSIPFLSDVTESLREINEPSAHYASTEGPEANCQYFSPLQQFLRERNVVSRLCKCVKLIAEQGGDSITRPMHGFYSKSLFAHYSPVLKHHSDDCV